MRATLVTWWRTVRESYWFVPSIMALSAIVLSFLTTAFDHSIGSEWLEKTSWLYANKPAGARAVLSTVAGSMITVAGVTFSMTILSIANTTSTVGPRLLNNFMRDRGNQFTLGVFISTFLYCLLVLRTVRNAETAPPDYDGEMELLSAFVPHVAIITGILMAIMSVGVLIFFIHHVPESIHVSNIVAGVGRDLESRISDQFPALTGEPHEEESEREVEADLPDKFYETASQVSAEGTGYIQYVSVDDVLTIAQEHDLVVRLRFRSGDFVTQGDILLLASPESRVNESVEASLKATFVWGNQRTMTQDLRFMFNQLLEVAMRALSPGVNDPYTAVYCMDWMQSTLISLANRELPDAHRYDEDQNLRVVAEPETFEAFASLVFDQLRPYVVADRIAALHMMEMIAKVAVRSPSKKARKLLTRHGCALRRGCETHLNDQRGKRLIAERYRTLIRLLHDDDYLEHVRETGDWIGGRA